VIDDVGELTRAVRELNKTLAGVLRVSTRDTGRAASAFAPFNGTITGTGTITVWTPEAGRRVLAKRVVVCGVVDTVLGASKPVAFYLADATTGEVVAPIAAADATAPAGTLLPAGGPVQIDLMDGCPGSAPDVALVVKANATIGAGGVARFFGVVVGSEVLA
jgi:hypothetical protein